MRKIVLSLFVLLIVGYGIGLTNCPSQNCHHMKCYMGSATGGCSVTTELSCRFSDINKALWPWTVNGKSDGPSCQNEPTKIHYYICQDKCNGGVCGKTYPAPCDFTGDVGDTKNCEDLGKMPQMLCKKGGSSY